MTSNINIYQPLDQMVVSSKFLIDIHLWSTSRPTVMNRNWASDAGLMYTVAPGELHPNVGRHLCRQMTVLRKNSQILSDSSVPLKKTLLSFSDSFHAAAMLHVKRSRFCWGDAGGEQRCASDLWDDATDYFGWPRFLWRNVQMTHSLQD